MYHTESFRYAVFAYDFDGATGAIANRSIWLIQLDPGGGEFPDGLTVDAEGFVERPRGRGAHRPLQIRPGGRSARSSCPSPASTAACSGETTSARS